MAGDRWTEADVHGGPGGPPATGPASRDDAVRTRPRAEPGRPARIVREP